MQKIFFLLILLAAKTHSFAQGMDSMFLYNGQVLVGDIKDANLGVITIDDRDLKFIKVRAYKIRHLVSGNSVFRIETEHKEVFYSQIRKTTNSGEIAVMSGNTIEIIAINEIAFLSPVQKNFFKRLDGNFGLGFSYSKSSDIGQINMNANVYYSFRKIQYQFTANLLSSIDSLGISRDNENVQLFGIYNLQHSWFASAQLLYQRNLELSLSRRFQEMIGAGNKFLIRRNWQILGTSGLSLGQERSTAGSETVTLEIPAMLRINYFRYEKVNLQLSANQALYFSVTQSGRIRYDGTLNIAYELMHNFYINLSFYTSYDNKPPESAGSRVDYGTTLSVSYKF